MYRRLTRIKIKDRCKIFHLLYKGIGTRPMSIEVDRTRQIGLIQIVAIDFIVR